MVMLHVKRGDENLFLYETSVTAATDAVIRELVSVFNGRLKIQRICMEIEELAEHGTMLPVEMIGLNDDQIEELKLKDTWADKCVPMGGFTFNKDPMCRRNGQQPNEAMRKVLANAMTDAKAMVDKVICSATNLQSLIFTHSMTEIVQSLDRTHAEGHRGGTEHIARRSHHCISDEAAAARHHTDGVRQHGGSERHPGIQGGH